MTKLWISPSLELRHAINGWPEEPQMSFGDYNPSEQKLYLDELAQAKADSIPFESITSIVKSIFYLPQKYSLSNKEAQRLIETNYKPDTFIQWHGEVEVVWQVRYMPGDKWIDVPNNKKLSDYNGWYSRKVARLVNPLPEVPMDPNAGISTSDIGAHSFTEAHQPDSIFTREDVTSMMEIARQDATRGLKDRILKEFNHAWHTDGSRYPDPEVTLQIVLDILGVK